MGDYPELPKRALCNTKGLLERGIGGVGLKGNDVITGTGRKGMSPAKARLSSKTII